MKPTLIYILVLLSVSNVAGQQPRATRPALGRRSTINTEPSSPSPSLFAPLSRAYEYLVTGNPFTTESVESVTQSASKFVFSDVLGYRVGIARLRRLTLLFSRMALGVAMILRGGPLYSKMWSRAIAWIQACQLVSFSLTTLRTFAGLPRIRLVLREALVLVVALLGLHLPNAIHYLPAVVIGLHAGKSCRGLVRAMRLTSEGRESFAESAAELAEDVVDDLTDGLKDTLGIPDDWWDDEPTSSEAELARWQLVGRIVSPIAAASAAAATLQLAAPFGEAPPPMVAAAVAGAFMLQRNVHMALSENWLYIRLAVVRWIPWMLGRVLWVLRYVVYPLKRIIYRAATALGALKRLVRVWLIVPLHDALVRVAPPLRHVKVDEFAKQLFALPSLGTKLASKLVRLLVRLARQVTPKGTLGFVREVLDNAERYLLPYGIAGLGVAVQMKWVKLSDLPKLYMLLLNPTKLMATAIQPAVQQVLAKAREANGLARAATSWLKA